jgi:alkylated DNA nucleotide flippase Atl1
MSKRLKQEKAKAFIASIPAGRWSAYIDVAVAGDSPDGAMGVGSWLSNRGDEVPNVCRILNARGEISEAWKAAGPGLPQGPEAVRTLLEAEGVVFDAAGRADQDQRWTVKDPRAATPQCL